jgi:MATE family multidrug resistance protein
MNSVPTPGSRSELSATIRLAVPVVAVQLGFMLMGVVDTLMVGRLSAQALASVAIGNLYFFNVSIFGTGTLMALDPIIAQGWARVTRRPSRGRSSAGFSSPSASAS